MRFFVATIVGLALAFPVAAVWTEPAVPLPGGAPAEPIRAEGDQTKLGSLELAGGASVVGPAAGNAQLRSALYGLGAYRTSSTVLAGAFGAAGGTAAPDTTNPDPVQVGVYGVAGSDSGNAVGVYGDAAGFANAWAGYFLGGSTGFGGSLAVTGANGSVVATSGATVTSNASPDAARATSVTTGKAGAYGSLTLDGSPGGEGAGVLGYIEPAVPSCVSQNCTGVVGADTETFTATAGRWGGYFHGNVRITGRLYNNSRLSAAPVLFTDPGTFGVPALSNAPSGMLLGVVAQTGGGTDATGGITSNGERLFVTDYLGTDTDIARINPATLRPDTPADVVTAANPLQQITFDGQNLWARSNNALRQLNGQTLAELGSWTFSKNEPLELTDAYPNAVSSAATMIGARRPSDGSLWYASVIAGVPGLDPVVDDASLASPTPAIGCTPIRQLVFRDPGSRRVWAGIPGPCGTPVANTSAGFILLNNDGTVFGASVRSYLTALGANGNAVGATFDSRNSAVWISTQRNAYPAGDPNNGNVQVLRLTDTATPPTVNLAVPLPNTVGYTASRLVYDGTAIWVAASTFGQNGFGYDGKLFRIPTATGVPQEIDRSGSAVGNSPIQDLYFDGRNLYLYGYNPGSAPRINYYLEKRSR